MKPMTTPGEARGRSTVDGGAEDREDEDRGADDLGGQANEIAGARVDRDGPKAERRRIVPAEDDEGQSGADERADELGRDVAARGRGVDLAGGEQGDRDGRVDVAPADVTDGVDGGEDREREGERDRRQLRAAERVVAGQQERQRHGPRADEHEDRGSDRLCGQLLGQRG